MKAKADKYLGETHFACMSVSTGSQPSARLFEEICLLEGLLDQERKKHINIKKCPENPPVRIPP